ncbi:acyl-CoA synthetase [Microbacterium sp. SSW1-59]|uniref:acyl-CoA synthetase n=1 Tax=Microbacterium xanthum TaxID=3079794 RepID=UPI002AD52217|nr:acyl-CoA synthetase [Microbacterium sp. SSW1-59]MDZ8200795.1 acyl-CoA synthetase [Microbacterium sp. SSW1-59]
MTATPSPRAFEVRHVQVARAVFAAIAAVMITFSSDHSAAVGLAVFSGFTLATALVHLAAAWLVYPAGSRWPSVLLGLLCAAAGMAAGIPPWRSTALFFVVVIAWAVLTGLVELIAGIRAHRTDGAGIPSRTEARDALVTGAITLVFAVATVLVSPDYSLTYTIDEAGTFELTGTIIAVGVLGFYTAIVAVHLGIAGASPRPKSAPAEATETADDSRAAEQKGADA